MTANVSTGSPHGEDDRPLACRSGTHAIRRDVLLEDGERQVFDYCTRKGCGYREPVTEDS